MASKIYNKAYSKLYLIELVIAGYLKSLNCLTVFHFEHPMNDLNLLSDCNILKYISCYVYILQFGSEW
jgi:hypothetical protein